MSISLRAGWASLLALLACQSPAPTPTRGIDATAPPSDSGACPAFSIDADKAIAVVLREPAVTARAVANEEPFIREKPTCESPFYVVGFQQNSIEDTARGPFRVSAVDANIEGKSLCVGANWIAIDAWKREKDVMFGVFDLPEIKGKEREVRRRSAGKHTLSAVLYACPTTANPKAAYSFEFGEVTEQNTVRFLWLSVDPLTNAMTVQNVVGDLSYSEWATTRTAREAALTGVPKRSGGGSFGYGTPESVARDVSTWEHATKPLLESIGAIVRVELYDKTYFVFVIDAPNDAPPSAELGKKILLANGDWPFELILANSKARFRFVGTAWEKVH
jgi:hypothetical protein